MIDTIFIKEIIEKDFQRVINNVVFENENHLKDRLTKFLKLNLPANINIKSEEITKYGVLDILVNNEFIIECPNVDSLIKECKNRNLLPPLPLLKYYPEMNNAVLVCVTESNSRESIESFLNVLEIAANIKEGKN